MRFVATVLLVLGAALIGYSLFMDISVDTGFGSRVVNLSLAQRQTHLSLLGIGAAIVGVLLWIAGSVKAKQQTAEKVVTSDQDDERWRRFYAKREQKTESNFRRCGSCKGMVGIEERKCSLCGEELA